MKPIIFDTDMVKAILENRKTETRRLVIPQPEGGLYRLPKSSCWPGYFADSTTARVCKPRYQPGDILYVRETWQQVYETECFPEAPNGVYGIRDLITNFDSISKVEAGISDESSTAQMPPRMKYYVFRASEIKFANENNQIIWRKPTHMPKEAARIFLRVKDVLTEPLKNIRYFDCLAEGIPYRQMEDDIIRDFAELWDSTIKPADRGQYGWDANPWVWVNKFERISRKEALEESR